MSVRLTNGLEPYRLTYVSHTLQDYVAGYIALTICRLNYIGSGVWQAHAATGPGQSHSYARKCKFCSVPDVRKTSNLFCWAGAGKRDCLMLLIPPCMPAFERAGFV